MVAVRLSKMGLVALDVEVAQAAGTSTVPDEMVAVQPAKNGLVALHVQVAGRRMRAGMKLPSSRGRRALM